MFKFSFFSKYLIFLPRSIFYMLQDYCNHFPKIPKHDKPQVAGGQARKNWVEWAIVWTMNQKVPGVPPLKQLERPSVIPLHIHLRQHVAINIPSNKSLRKLVCGHVAPWRNRTSRIQLLKHCLPSPQAEPIMEPLDSVTFFASSAFQYETLCMCTYMCAHSFSWWSILLVWSTCFQVFCWSKMTCFFLLMHSICHFFLGFSRNKQTNKTLKKLVFLALEKYLKFLLSSGILLWLGILRKRPLETVCN